MHASTHRRLKQEKLCISAGIDLGTVVDLTMNYFFQQNELFVLMQEYCSPSQGHGLLLYE